MNKISIPCILGVPLSRPVNHKRGSGACRSSNHDVSVYHFHTHRGVVLMFNFYKVSMVPDLCRAAFFGVAMAKRCRPAWRKGDKYTLSSSRLLSLVVSLCLLVQNHLLFTSCHWLNAWRNAQLLRIGRMFVEKNGRKTVQIITKGIFSMILSFLHRYLG